MKKFFFVILILLLFFTFVFVVLIFLLPAKEIIIEKEQSQAASLVGLDQLKKRRQEDSTITIFAVGDIMLDRGVEYMIRKQGDGDFKFPFLKIRDYLKKADILFGNLESIISDKGRKVGSIYSFRAKLEAIESLKYAGFDILSLANNHALDYTKEALEDCLNRLKEANIDYVGAGFTEKEAFSVKIKEIRGTKIGFLAYTNLGPKIWRAAEKGSGIAWVGENDIERTKKDIKAAKQKVDILIISLHAGEEYSLIPTPFQVSFARACIDAGADLIIGHHPHVIQPIEKYKGGWIIYSLGNFVFDQNFSKETMKGLLLEVTIENKEIKAIDPREVKISNHYQPYLNPEN